MTMRDCSIIIVVVFCFAVDIIHPGFVKIFLAFYTPRKNVASIFF